VAAELRTLFTTIKIVTDVERMADYAVDIARIAILIKDEDITSTMADIKKMAHTVCVMLRESIDAYTMRDDDHAYEITKLDDEVDLGLINLVKYLYHDMGKGEGDHFRASQINFIGKYL